MDSHHFHFQDHFRTRWWRGNGEGRAQSQQQEQAKLGEDNFCLCLFFSRKQEQNWVKTTSAFVNLNDDNQQNSVKTNLANHFQIRNKTQNYPKIGKNAKIFDLHPGGLVTTLTQRFEALERGSGWSQGSPPTLTRMMQNSCRWIILPLERCTILLWISHLQVQLKKKRIIIWEQKLRCLKCYQIYRWQTTWMGGTITHIMIMLWRKRTLST